MNEQIVIDAEHEILGRVASFAAKQLLQGKKVAIVHCNRALISGNRSFIIHRYLKMRRRTKVRFPSTPEKIMKRTVRGMIDYKSGRGQLAWKRIRCYNEFPEMHKHEKTIKLGNKNRDWMDLKELGNSLKQGRRKHE